MIGLPTDKKIIHGIMDTSVDDDRDPDDDCVLPNVSANDAFQATVTLTNNFLQQEKRYTKCSACLAKNKGRG